MIMQNLGGENDFFTDFLNTPPASALHESDAPMSDWRFVPQKIGRRRFRMDVPHAAAGSMKVRIRQDRSSAYSPASQNMSALYFG